MIFKAKWIKAPYETGYVATVFKKDIKLKKEVELWQNFLRNYSCCLW